jgi:Icc protein
MINKLMIAQISDTHIGATDLPNIHTGINVRQQFLAVLNTLAKKPLDLLVLSGDLAAEYGEIEAYQWLKQTLERLPFPYIVMAGNHDRVSTLSEVFEIPSEDITGGLLYFHRTLKGWHLLFLDSSSYFISQPQITWLRQQLTRIANEPVLLFVHHPPLLCGCRFLDESYSLKNINEVWPVLTQLSAIQAIFCGHYHTERSIIREGQQVYLTPSTMLQINPDTPDFQIAHTYPGWRIIHCQEKQVYTYVEFLCDSLPD